MRHEGSPCPPRPPRPCSTAISGIATTGAWLPAGLGTFGQLLPPGAAGSLVRAAAYFGGAGGLGAGLTLGAWVLAGAVMLALAGVVARRREPAAAVV